jgi:hypothetical protein
MVAATALELWRRGHLQWHDHPSEFHKNLPNGSNVEGWVRHMQTGRMVISLAYIFPLEREFGEKRLKSGTKIKQKVLE